MQDGLSIITRRSGGLSEKVRRKCLTGRRLFEIGAVKMQAGYVNGTRGTVIDINEMDLPVVKTLAGL